MTVLVVGREKGSWQMRGRQLGHALGATVQHRPTLADFNAADVIVLVKRAPWIWFRELKEAQALLVWDVLDFWHQPSGNTRTRDDLLASVHEIRRELKVSLLIGATKQMADDIGGLYLPHHHRIGLTAVEPRRALQVVGYDGNARYLGRWQPALERACKRLGLTFVMNPSDLRQVDLFVAFRDAEWDGWACREWKSGVKYVNAMAAGRPILTQPCAAFEEIQPCGSLLTDPEQLEDTIAGWRDCELREAVVFACRQKAKAYTLEAIAKQYRAIVQSVAEPVHV